jgi:hypothetical protein
LLEGEKKRKVSEGEQRAIYKLQAATLLKRG